MISLLCGTRTVVVDHVPEDSRAYSQTHNERRLQQPKEDIWRVCVHVILDEGVELLLYSR
jgi:hypothetical protein